MKVFSVTGLSGSGKTSVIEKLIAELTARGYTVGTVKEIHFEQFALDDEGKNTWRHRAAGAGTVTARAHRETDIMYQGHLPIYEVLSHYAEDFVILEGVRDAVVPEIAVCREDATPQIGPLTVAVSGRFANGGQREYNNLPVFNGLTEAAALADFMLAKTPDLMPDVPAECCSACGVDCRAFLSGCLKGERSADECALKNKRVTLKLDGKEIPMVPFVENILKNAVSGVITELKGYKKGALVSVEFTGD